MKKWIWVLVALVLAWNSFLTYRLLSPSNNNENISGDIDVIEEAVTDYTTDLTSVVENARSSVVRVNYSYGRDVLSTSGVIFAVNEDRVYVITSRIATTSNIIVVFDNGKTSNARVEKSDVSTGISILSFETEYNVEPFRLGDSSLLEQGEYVIALGARYERGSAPVSFGIVSESGLRRMSATSPWLADILETDASINKEFYGGALMNVGGELVGIIVETPLDSESNMGFALSVDEARLVFNEVLEGDINRGTTRVITRDIDNMRSYEKSAWNISLNRNNGVLVLNALDNLEDGLQVGDVIVSFNGEEINNYQDLRKLEYSMNEGDVVKLEVIRASRNIEIDVELK